MSAASFPGKLRHTLSFLGLIALGFWAYRENYATQATVKDVTQLQQKIANLREEIALQRAEWAYLNRPDRLRELATLNFDRLGLLPMEPSQFGTTGQVAYPPPPVAAELVPDLGAGLGIDSPVDVQGTLDAAQEQTP